MIKKATTTALPPKVPCDGCVYQEINELVMWCGKIKMSLPIDVLNHCIYKTDKK